MFYVHPYLEKIPILSNIFQMGWNHQLVMMGKIEFILSCGPNGSYFVAFLAPEFLKIIHHICWWWAVAPWIWKTRIFVSEMEDTGGETHLKN